MDDTGLARKNLIDIISTWKRRESWKYSLRFIRREDSKLHFECVWSIPTRRRPIPYATATVNFTVDQTHSKHNPLIFYTLEEQSLQRLEGEATFKEKWLDEIVTSKVQLRAQNSLEQIEHTAATVACMYQFKRKAHRSHSARTEEIKSGISNLDVSFGGLAASVTSPDNDEDDLINSTATAIAAAAAIEKD